MPPTETATLIRKAWETFLFNRKIYFFCNPKLIIIPVPDEMILEMTGLKILFTKVRYNP